MGSAFSSTWNSLKARFSPSSGSLRRGVRQAAGGLAGGLLTPETAARDVPADRNQRSWCYGWFSSPPETAAGDEPNPSICLALWKALLKVSFPCFVLAGWSLTAITCGITALVYWRRLSNVVTAQRIFLVGVQGDSTIAAMLFFIWRVWTSESAAPRLLVAIVLIVSTALAAYSQLLYDTLPKIEAWLFGFAVTFFLGGAITTGPNPDIQPTVQPQISPRREEENVASLA